MSEHHATIDWKRETPDFAYETYNRDHDWSFDAGITVRASANLAYLGSETCVDPEEALVAATSSCHMLFFLSFAQKAGFLIDAYSDEASGLMEPDASGKQSIARITLRPRIAFAGEKRPTGAELADLHHNAHEHCYIANSIRAEVMIEPAS